MWVCLLGYGFEDAEIFPSMDVASLSVRKGIFFLVRFRYGKSCKVASFVQRFSMTAILLDSSIFLHAPFVLGSGSCSG